MKASAIFAGLVALLPSIVWAQDVQLRLYTAHPPTEIKITGDQIAGHGQFHWKSCTTCVDKSDRELSLESAALAVKIRTADTAETVKEIHLAGAYHLRSPDSPEFSANFPLHIESSVDGLVITVTMPLESYVQAVLAAESGDFTQAESMKAMAVVVRTYAERFRGQHKSEGFDFCDTTHCQAVRWNEVNPRIVSAVSATQGEILRFGGTPAETFYHQNCGGTIAAASEVWPSVEEPYLRGHADPYCAAASPLKWESNISVRDIDQALKESGLAPPKGWKTVDILSHGASGRVQRLKLDGGNFTNFAVSGSSFRFAVDRALGWNKIRSDLYEITNSDGHIIFSGRGSGHGVGLCQAGAEEMARDGKNYSEILAFYYPGTDLSATQAQAGTWQKRSGERIELVSMNPDADSSVLPIAERILKEDEASIGWQLPFRARLQIFPTLDLYRNSTGQPGWVAASTRGRTIRLQPLIELQRRSIVKSTLRHEWYHMLVESHSRAETPVWFREGLVLVLSGSPDSADAGESIPKMTDQEIETVLRQSADRAEMERAYAAARGRVASLVGQYGKATVLGWLSTGLPEAVVPRSASPNPYPTHK